MRAKFLSSEGEYLEAQLEIKGQTLHVMDEFDGKQFEPGDEIDVEIQPGLIGESESWESIFSSNPKREKKLEHQSGWKYRAYGIVTSVNPVIVDCGIISVEAPISTNDKRIIGSSIAFSIDRLDARN